MPGSWDIWSGLVGSKGPDGWRLWVGKERNEVESEGELGVIMRLERSFCIEVKSGDEAESGEPIEMAPRKI